MSLVEKAVFQNCLVVMRPKTKAQELPSAYQVVTYLQNEFLSWINQTKQAILVLIPTKFQSTFHRLLTHFQAAPGKVLVTANGWSAPMTKASYFGMTGHWINMSSDGKWTMHQLVLDCKPISGSHSGKNLACFFISICHHVGVISDGGSKVCFSLLLSMTSMRSQPSVQLRTATLNNALNNTTTCKHISAYHNSHNLSWNEKEN